MLRLTLYGVIGLIVGSLGGLVVGPGTTGMILGTALGLGVSFVVAQKMNTRESAISPEKKLTSSQLTQYLVVSILILGALIYSSWE